MALNATKTGNSVTVQHVEVLRALRKSTNDMARRITTPDEDNRWKNVDKATEIIRIAQAFNGRSPTYTEAVIRIFLTIAGEDITQQTDVRPRANNQKFVDGAVIVLSENINDYPANTPIIFTERLGVYVQKGSRGGLTVGHGGGWGGYISEMNRRLMATVPTIRLATEEEIVTLHDQIARRANVTTIDVIKSKSWGTINYYIDRF